MEKKQYLEMVESLTSLMSEIDLAKKHIFLFGHCNASLELIDLLEAKGLQASAILDNSDEKQGREYRGVEVVYPKQINELSGDNPKEDSIVLIASRFYESMHKQLRELGYEGPVRKVIDYNTYADYSLSDETINRMQLREQAGERLTKDLEEKYPGYFKVFFPFNALGDVYLAMSYWPHFAQKRSIGKTVFCVPAPVLADVVHLFGNYPVEIYEQKLLDSMIQAAIYTQDKDSYIAHHDRPYVINLHRALYVKKIPMELIYRCGVFGLERDTEPVLPKGGTERFSDLDSIPKGKSVIFSPYAKSVTAIDDKVWKNAIAFYAENGFKCYTNVVGDEKPLDGTEPISPTIAQLRSVIEQAGTFVGIRSGLCDVIRNANAKKIALYPDYNYCDTQWKAIDIYWIDQFDYNILATEEIEWEKL